MQLPYLVPYDESSIHTRLQTLATGSNWDTLMAICETHRNGTKLEIEWAEMDSGYGGKYDHSIRTLKLNQDRKGQGSNAWSGTIAHETTHMLWYDRGLSNSREEEHYCMRAGTLAREEMGLQIDGGGMDALTLNVADGVTSDKVLEAQEYAALPACSSQGAGYMIAATVESQIFLARRGGGVK